MSAIKIIGKPGVQSIPFEPDTNLYPVQHGDLWGFDYFAALEGEGFIVPESRYRAFPAMMIDYGAMHAMTPAVVSIQQFDPLGFYHRVFFADGSKRFAVAVPFIRDFTGTNPLMYLGFEPGDLTAGILSKFSYMPGETGYTNDQTKSLWLINPSYVHDNSSLDFLLTKVPLSRVESRPEGIIDRLLPGIILGIAFGGILSAGFDLFGINTLKTALGFPPITTPTTPGVSPMDDYFFDDWGVVDAPAVVTENATNIIRDAVGDVIGYYDEAGNFVDLEKFGVSTTPSDFALPGYDQFGNWTGEGITFNVPSSGLPAQIVAKSVSEMSWIERAIKAGSAAMGLYSQYQKTQLPGGGALYTRVPGMTTTGGAGLSNFFAGNNLIIFGALAIAAVALMSRR